MKSLFTGTPSIVLAVGISTVLAPFPISADNALLSSLQGCWHGEALKTPVGPRAYPICFALDENNELYGMAELTVSQHHWRFQFDESATTLNFLSTFAGNQTPINLSAISTSSDKVTFATHNKDYLQVQVLQLEQEYQFTIRIRGEEHVIIHLVQKK